MRFYAVCKNNPKISSNLIKFEGEKCIALNIDCVLPLPLPSQKMNFIRN